MKLAIALRNPWLWALLGLMLLALALVWLVRRVGFANIERFNSLLDVITAATSRLAFPVPGFAIGSGDGSDFGPRTPPVPGASANHLGIDIPAPEGTLVVASANGVVTRKQTTSKGGKEMSITHDDGSVAGYAHLKDYLVDLDERVSRGEPVALIGATGNVSGPHLHFSYRPKSGAAPVDPEPLFA